MGLANTDTATLLLETSPASWYTLCNELGNWEGKLGLTLLQQLDTKWISHGSWQENKVSSFYLSTGKTRRFFFFLITSVLVVCCGLFRFVFCWIPFKLLFFYCHFYCATGWGILMARWLICGKVGAADLISIAQYKRDMKKLPPLFLRVRFTVNSEFCTIFTVIL